MKMFHYIKLLALLFVFSPVASPLRGDTRDIKVPVIPSARIVFDGKFNEDIWANLPWHGDFFELKRPLPALKQTRFKLFATTQGLYFAIDCQDEKIRNSQRLPDGDIWEDDCIELFLTGGAQVNFDPNTREIYHIAINPSGVKYDSLIRGGVNHKTWDSGCRRGTNITDKSWQVELFVPFHAFNFTDNGAALRFNLARENYDDKRLTLSSWANLQYFLEADKYPLLQELPIEYERHNVELTDCAILMENTAQSIIPVTTLKLRGTPKRRMEAKFITYSKNKIIGVSNVDFTVAADGKATVRAPLHETRDFDYLTKILLCDRGEIIKSAQFTGKVSMVPLKLAVEHPIYRNNLYPSELDRVARLTCSLLLPAQNLGRYNLSCTIIAPDGKVLEKQNIDSPKERNLIRFDLANRSAGVYTFSFALWRYTEKVCEFQETIRIVAPTQGIEVRLDRERRLLVDGKPFFPSGFLGTDTVHMPLLRDAGFNVMHSYVLQRKSIPEILAFLDQAHAHGLKVVFYPFHLVGIGFWGFNIPGKERSVTLDEENSAQMLKMVNAVKEHPAFLAWLLCDEPRGVDFLKELNRIYKLLKVADPNHPVIHLDNTAEGCVENLDNADIHALDRYPSPRAGGGNERPLVTICNQLAAIYAASPGKGVWHCPQSFDGDSFVRDGGKRQFRAPTFAESRCNVYAGVIEGASGVLPFLIGDPASRYFVRYENSGIFSSPELKIGYLEGLGPELQTLMPVLNSRRLPERAVATAWQLRVLTFEKSGQKYLFAVNPTPRRIKDAAITLRGEWSTELLVIGENRKIDVGNGRLADNFEPFAVHIYTENRNFVTPVNLAEIQKKIDRTMLENNCPYKMSKQKENQQ